MFCKSQMQYSPFLNRKSSLYYKLVLWFEENSRGKASNRVQMKMVLIPYARNRLGLKFWLWTVILSSTELLPKKNHPTTLVKLFYSRTKRKGHQWMHGITTTLKDEEINWTNVYWKKTNATWNTHHILSFRFRTWLETLGPHTASHSHMWRRKKRNSHTN